MLYLIIAAGLLFAVTIVAFKLIKDSIKVMALIISLLVLIVITGSVLLYLDAKDLREHMAYSNTTVLIVDENLNEIVAGFTAKINNITEKTYFDTKLIKEYNEKYKTQTLGVNLKDSYKIILINYNALNNTLPDRIIISDEKVVSKTFFFNLLASNNAIDYYVEKVVQGMILENSNEKELKQTLKDNLDIADDKLFKSMISGLVFDSMLKNNPEKIILEYKKGNIAIIPETLMLKLIKIVPDDKLKDQLNSIKNKVKEKVENKTKEKIEETIGTII